VTQTTFNKKIGLYSSPQTIVSSVPMGDPTRPSLSHSTNMKLIFNIHRDTEDHKKTKITVYSDEQPYKVKQEIKIDYKIYHATCATDRRSDTEQNQNKIAIFGFNAFDDSNKLFKIKLNENNNLEHFLSDEKFDAKLLKCIIVSDTRLISVRP
jgi:hypothetical protein